MDHKFNASTHSLFVCVQKHASTVEDYESQIAHLTSSMTKLEAAKTRLDDEMMMMTSEQVCFN